MSAAEPDAGYIARLISRHEVAERTTAFRFEKPRGFSYTAGQFAEFILPPQKGEGAGEQMHPFTLSSAPHEPFLMVTTRMRDSEFKRRLGATPIGAELTVKGPFGELVLDTDPGRPAVFLTGGIGVTPFRSIVVDATARKSPHRIVMFYSNRRPEDAAFLDELQRLEKENPKFTLVATMTQMPKSDRSWKGEVGKIDTEMIARHRKGGGTPVYFIAGPPGMVNGLHEMLTKGGIDEPSIRTEQFDGY
ncbi:MAG: FAD-dependent oxidoreductase [Thermoplasmata archaeon]|nr:FAD-dependent oxidoreductase [Thermoplasmata archaeon]